MSRARYTAGTTGKFTGTLRDEAGTAIPLSSVSALTVTLTDAASGATVNSRNAQNALNANGVELDSAGTLTWSIAAADTTLLSSTRDVEEHVCVFSWAYGAKVGKAEHRLRCVARLQLCTFDDVKLILPELPDAEQEHIEVLIESVSERAESETSRRFRYATETEVFSPARGQSTVQLRRYPVASVVSVKEDAGGVFSTALTSDSYDIASMGDRGVLALRGRSFLDGVGVLQVVYAGGLARDPGAVPMDLRSAAMRQVVFWYQRRSAIGLSGESISGASVSIYATQDLLPDVRAVLNAYTPRTIL